MLNKRDLNSIGLALAPLFAREVPSKDTSTQIDDSAAVLLQCSSE